MRYGKNVFIVSRLKYQLLSGSSFLSIYLCVPYSRYLVHLCLLHSKCAYYICIRDQIYLDWRRDAIRTLFEQGATKHKTRSSFRSVSPCTKANVKVRQQSVNDNGVRYRWTWRNTGILCVQDVHIEDNNRSRCYTRCILYVIPCYYFVTIN